MLNFSRRDRPADAQDAKVPVRPALRPAAIYEPPGSPAAASSNSPSRALPPDPASAPAREPLAGSGSAPRPDPVHSGTASGTSAAPATSPVEAPGSKLFVGVNIKLQGVEISDCDLLVVEGHVEATVHSKAMQIAKPGTVQGTAHIDIAEIHGEFTGELTARTRLVVHGTGRVSGTIRYGKLIVADGGAISGDVKQHDVAEPPAARPPTQPTQPPRRTAHDAR
jgi:cytoskeletal protein CcmA (bactofilin family)